MRAIEGWAPALDSHMSAERIALTVKEWVKRCPLRTRQSVFLEQYPNAKLENGVLHINPCKVDSSFSRNVECSSLQCPKCQREFWLEEIKDD